jgi:hypothetical protein
MRISLGCAATLAAILLVPSQAAVCMGIVTLTTMEIVRRRRLRIQALAF